MCDPYDPYDHLADLEWADFEKERDEGYNDAIEEINQLLPVPVSPLSRERSHDLEAQFSRHASILDECALYMMELAEAQAQLEAGDAQSKGGFARAALYKKRYTVLKGRVRQFLWENPADSFTHALEVCVERMEGVSESAAKNNIKKADVIDLKLQERMCQARQN